MTYKKHSQSDRDNVIRLFEEGKNKCEISRLTGIHRATLRDWIFAYQKGITKSAYQYDPQEYLNDFLQSEEKRKAYSFVLGLYLCDGYISQYKTHRAESIRMFNDVKYEQDTLEWANNLQILFPENKVSIRKLKSNCKEVKTYSKKISILFPHVQKGRKHERKLIFTDWQMDILKQYPKEFIRACFQSDGCIYLQKCKNKFYKRYAFTNKSQDIIDLFLYCLKLVGIEKQKYLHPDDKYVIQNFKKDHLPLLESIIFEKK
jgi:transposase